MISGLSLRSIQSPATRLVNSGRSRPRGVLTLMSSTTEVCRSSANFSRVARLLFCRSTTSRSIASGVTGAGDPSSAATPDQAGDRVAAEPLRQELVAQSADAVAIGGIGDIGDDAARRLDEAFLRRHLDRLALRREAGGASEGEGQRRDHDRAADAEIEAAKVFATRQSDPSVHLSSWRRR